MDLVESLQRRKELRGAPAARAKAAAYMKRYHQEHAAQVAAKRAAWLANPEVKAHLAAYQAARRLRPEEVAKRDARKAAAKAARPEEVARLARLKAKYPDLYGLA